MSEEERQSWRLYASAVLSRPSERLDAQRAVEVADFMLAAERQRFDSCGGSGTAKEETISEALRRVGRAIAERRLSPDDPCDYCGAPMVLTGDEDPKDLCASCFADFEKLGAGS